MLVFTAFFLVWLLMSGEVSVHVCVCGLGASALMTAFCRWALGYRLRMEKRIVGKLGAGIAYAANLLWEMLKAAVVVIKMIYTCGRDTQPELVWFDTTLESDAARTVLANSITLTPGTITVAAENGRFCVHALDKSLAVGIEDCDFQRRLEKLEA